MNGTIEEEPQSAEDFLGHPGSADEFLDRPTKEQIKAEIEAKSTPQPGIVERGVLSHLERQEPWLRTAIELPGKAAAAFGNTAAKLADYLSGVQQPAPVQAGVPLVPITVPPDANIRPALRPYAEAAANLISGFTTPENTLMLPLAGTKVAGVPAALGKTFVASMVGGAVQTYPEVKAIVDHPNVSDAEKKRVAAEWTIGAELGVAGVGGMGRGQVKPTVYREPGQPTINITPVQEVIAKAAPILPEASKAAAEVVTPKTTEVQNAETIRSNQGQRTEVGQVIEGIEANRGNDVEQTTPGQPEPVVARAGPQTTETAPAEVPLTETPKLSGAKLNKEFNKAFDALDQQKQYNILSEMGYDIDENSGRWFMEGRDNERYYLTGDQLADAKRDFIQRATSPKPVEPSKVDAAQRLIELKKLENPTPEEIAERDSLQAKSDSVKDQMQTEFEKLKKGAQTEVEKLGEMVKATEPTLFPNNEAAAALQRVKDALKPKAGIQERNPFLEPQFYKDVVTVAGNVVERGARDFARFSKEMIAQFGEGVSPYLKAIYNDVREHPKSGNLKSGMTGADELSKFNDVGEPMGAAKPEEFTNAGNPDTYGVAERVREERAKAGQVAPVEPGEGIAAADSVERGRGLLEAGADPRKVLADFEATQRLSSDDMAIVRAHGERLAKIARDTEEKYGTDSDEYRKAWQELSDWDRRTKPMQTEWHKTGQAQQGETDIDTGSFTGLQRAHQEASGKDFTPNQAAKAKTTAAKVRTAEKATAKAETDLANDLKEGPKPSATSAAEKRALDAASRTVRDAAVNLAEAERKAMVAEAERKAAADKLAKAQEIITDKTITDATVKRAARAAKEAAQRDLKAAKYAKQVADFERDRLQKVVDATNKRIREAAAKTAKAERERMANPEKAVWDKVKDYLDQGLDSFDEIRGKVATDLGMNIDQVTRWLTANKRTKFLADEVWKRQQAERNLREQARRWLRSVDTPWYHKAIANVPKALFGLKVGFHGTVALGTHAPMVAFQPRFWNTYARDFFKMYRMVGSRAYYERQVQNLLRNPNYITARRAGLVNDPFVFEDYNSPDMVKYVKGLTGMGNRGYAVLKILRQDMFDQMWNKLPKTAQIPEVAQAIADGLNHATGVVKGKAPPGSNVALFAPRLLASRVMWLAVDPIKSADIFARWKTASVGEKQFAINQMKEKAWVAGTLFAMLAINQGILSATGSKQKINLTDPMKSDFWKFKAAGMTASYGNAMLNMARLPVRMYQIRESNGGKLRNVVYPDEDVYSVLGEYGRTQLSPFASLVTSLWFQSDWMRRQLPGSNRPMPARLRHQGVKPYTWAEFLTEQVLPIPAEEAAREVWKHGLGMSDEQIVAMRKALATISVMGATGARLTEDVDLKKPTPE